MFEAGAARQNAYLMSAALGLNVIPMGGMNPEMVAKVIGVNYQEKYRLLLTVSGDNYVPDLL